MTARGITAIMADLETWKEDLGQPNMAPRLTVRQRQAVLDEAIQLARDHVELLASLLVDETLKGPNDGGTGSGTDGERDRAVPDVHGIAPPGPAEPRP